MRERMGRLCAARRAARSSGPRLGGGGLPVSQQEGGRVFSRRLGLLGQREHQLELARVELFARGTEHPAQNEIDLLAQEPGFLSQALVLGRDLG